MIFGLKIIKKKEYQELKGIKKQWDEREAITKNNDIEKEKKKLEKKYKKYFGRWFEHPEGFILQIKGVAYDHSYSYSSFHHFKFSCYVPNLEGGWTDISFDEIVKDEDSNEENMCNELTEQEVKTALM